MPYPHRIECESEIYHLTARGVGRMNIFEDDDDRRKLLELLSRSQAETSVEIYAWCLMSNHIHLIVRGPLEETSRMMRKTLGPYAMFFNSRHGRVGHLFQGRFASVPVLGEAQLLSAIRYVHDNPAEAGICACDEYPWSSYREYTGKSEYASTEPVLEMLGGTQAFVDLHKERRPGEPEPEWRSIRKAMSESEAKRIAADALGRSDLEGIAAMEKGERDEALAKLKEAGLSIRQIERLTGIGRNIVHRASRK